MIGKLVCIKTYKAPAFANIDADILFLKGKTYEYHKTVAEAATTHIMSERKKFELVSNLDVVKKYFMSIADARKLKLNKINDI